MNGMQWLLEIVLIALLGTTLFYALRLERALGVLKRDRATLEELVVGFNGATRQAQQGIDQLQEAAEGAGRQMSRQIETVTALKEDLLFLTERGDRVADRLDVLVRNNRGALDPQGAPERMSQAVAAEGARSAMAATELSQTAALDLARAFNLDDGGAMQDNRRARPAETVRPVSADQFRGVSADQFRGVSADPSRAASGDTQEPEEAPSRMRSQAERDLLKALRMAR